MKPTTAPGTSSVTTQQNESRPMNPPIPRTTDHRPETTPSGLVLYDGECDFCVSSVRRVSPVLMRAGFDFKPLQAVTGNGAESEAETINPASRFDSMIVVTADGRRLQTAEAVVHLASKIWWARPVCWIARWPWGMGLVGWCYKRIAENRYCFHGSCSRPSGAGWRAWLPLVVLPAASFVLRSHVPSWVWMWVLSAAIFFGLKWLTFWQAEPRSRRAAGWRSLAYLIGWVGMDATAFFGTPRTNVFIARREWLRGLLNTIAGAALLWGVSPRIPSENHLLAGWTGLVGLMLILHFGLVHLLALVWQAFGVNAEQIMRKPLRSRSLSEFWGSRWNLGFRQLSHDLVFQPLRPRVGIAGATVTAFLASGLVHDLVISVPAGGGYGLPTAYFGLQGLGVILERSGVGMRVGLGAGLLGRAFAVLVTAGPAFFLFHPMFVERITLPMLVAVGAR